MIVALEMNSLVASASQFVATKLALGCLVVEALRRVTLSQMTLSEYYPDADVIVRIRQGTILPDIDIHDRVREDRHELHTN